MTSMYLQSRKGSIYISVVAPSEAIAKKFAAYVMEQIVARDDKQKSTQGFASIQFGDPTDKPIPNAFVP